MHDAEDRTSEQVRRIANDLNRFYTDKQITTESLIKCAIEDLDLLADKLSVLEAQTEPRVPWGEVWHE